MNIVAWFESRLSGRPGVEEDLFDPVSIQGIAEFLITLEKATFSSIGSLELDGDGNIQIGPVVDINPINSIGSVCFRGPYQSPKGYYLNHYTIIIENIINGSWRGAELDRLGSARLGNGGAEIAESIDLLLSNGFDGQFVIESDYREASMADVDRDRAWLTERCWRVRQGLV